MKYIKGYSEGFFGFDSRDDTKEKELLSFCKMYLVDLVDIGSSIRIEYSGPNHYTFNLFNIDLPTWGDIKDSLIPFIEMLTKEYDIISDVLFKGRYSNLAERYTVDEILSGCDLKDNYMIIRIIFDIKLKK